MSLFFTILISILTWRVLEFKIIPILKLFKMFIGYRYEFVICEDWYDLTFEEEEAKRTYNKFFFIRVMFKNKVLLAKSFNKKKCTEKEYKKYCK